MQKQNWSLSSPHHNIAVEDYDDDNDVQPGGNTFYNRNMKLEEREEQTLKPENTLKTAKQTMLERKLQEADTRGEYFK